MALTVDCDTIGWQVGNKIYDNKWTAILEYTNCPTNFSFYYYDRTWDKFNWLIEPALSTQELERRHCEHLRKNNDLLILAYSGGLDSNTVLRRFIESKQFLDYVICFSVTNDVSHPSDFEVKVARRELEKLRSLLPGTKFLFVNENIDVLNRTRLGNGIQNFDGKNIQNTNFELRFHHDGWAERLKVEHPTVYDELKNKNGKIIIGSHKPEISLQSDGNFWFTPIDKQDENIQDAASYEFFWSGQDPTLFIKQCHLAKQWLKNKGLHSSHNLSRIHQEYLYLDFSMAIGRESPINPIFAVKNCYGGYTNMEYLNQHCGIKHDVHKQLCEVDAFKENIKKLDKFVIDMANKFPQLINYDKKIVDVYGWLGKPRCLGN